MKQYFPILLISLIIIPVIATGQTRQVINFTDLLTSLKNGETVKVVIYYNKCKMISDGIEKKGPDAIGGMEITEFEFFNKKVVRNEKAFISCSKEVLISHPFYGHVLNYIKLRIYEDNNVEIIARYLNPVNYEIKMDETFYGEIDDGQLKKAVLLFKN